MKMKILASSIALIGVSLGALAQTTAPARVEVTGSSIKQLAAEAMLPVQIVSKDDLEKAGITSAEQFVATLASNVSGMHNQAAQTDGFGKGTPHNNGAAGASLRGLGAGSTLVLLNGRRIATHGLNGKSVDLNAIPMAAVERVEVLHDGASAIYGTDAIGGVINFILKKNFRGMEGQLFTDMTEAGGANIQRGSLTYGFGALDTDRFNVLASVSFEKNTALESKDRDFAKTAYQPARGLGIDASSAMIANIRSINRTTGYAREVWVSPLTMSGAGCQSVANTYPDTYNGRNNCLWDYTSQVVLAQPNERNSVMVRGSFKLSDQHQAFAEYIMSRNDSQGRYTPFQSTNDIQPTNAQYIAIAPQLTSFFGAYNAVTNPTGFDATKPIRVRWRFNGTGHRTEDTRAENSRLLGGLEGIIGNWDYKLGLSSSSGKAATTWTNGYVFSAPMTAAINSGLVNIFTAGPQAAAGQALLDAAQARGVAYAGKTGMRQLDATVSGELFNLPAGPVGAAFGLDVRRETFEFNPGLADAAFGALGSTTYSKFDVSRNINAVFAEFNVPLAKSLDAQIAVRRDDYSLFGSTTNPKIGVRYQPTKALAFRGSAGHGFHAPDFEDLFGGISRFTSSGRDPLLPANAPQVSFDTVAGPNPKLKPETSKQWSIGTIISPAGLFTTTVDAWKIKRKDRVLFISADDVLLPINYPSFTANVIRDAGGNITEVHEGPVNSGGDEIKGIDLTFATSGNSAWGKWAVNIEGTYLLGYKTQTLPSTPVLDYTGKYSDENVWPRWKHTAQVSLTQGPWTTALVQSYTSRYDDMPYTGDFVLAVPAPALKDRVGSYTLHHLSVTYNGFKNTALTFGVKNLFDKDPPFTIKYPDHAPGAGWDSRTTDPRGRSFTLRLNYKFF